MWKGGGGCRQQRALDQREGTNWEERQRVWKQENQAEGEKAKERKRLMKSQKAGIQCESSRRSLRDVFHYLPSYKKGDGAPHAARLSACSAIYLQSN